MDQTSKGDFVPRHTSMPARTQRTPHGDVTLTSRWQRDRYYLMAYGPEAAIRWMFPKASHLEQREGGVRHTFDPAPSPITVERELRKTSLTTSTATKLTGRTRKGRHVPSRR